MLCQDAAPPPRQQQQVAVRFANKLLAAAAGLLSLCLQKRFGRVEPLCEEADTPTNNEAKQSAALCLLSPNISLCDTFNLSNNR